MPRFAANLSMMYTEHAFLERFAAAAADGFRAVEFLFPYEWPAATLAAKLAEHRLEQVLFNAPPGDFAGGERGIACLPGRESEFGSGVERALDYAAALRCPRIHVMAGLVLSGSSREALRARYLANLAWAAQRRQPPAVDVLIEPINTRDIPGYFLNRQDEAHAIVAAIDVPHLKVQMDLYHCQIVEGDVAMKLRKYLPGGRVGHLQIAGVPERHEPDSGELDYDYLFEVDRLAQLRRLDRLRVPPGGGNVGRPRLAAPRTRRGGGTLRVLADPPSAHRGRTPAEASALRLPEAERGPGRVDDDAQPTHAHDLGDVLHHGRTECLGFLGRGGDVVDLDIGEPERGGAGNLLLHQAAAGAAADLDHRIGAVRHRHVLELPVEELAVEGFRGRHVGRAELDVDEGVAHVDLH